MHRSLGDWDSEKLDFSHEGPEIIGSKYPEVCKTIDGKAIISKVPSIQKLPVPQTNDALIGLICTDGLTDISSLTNVFLALKSKSNQFRDDQEKEEKNQDEKDKEREEGNQEEKVVVETTLQKIESVPVVEPWNYLELDSYMNNLRKLDNTTVLLFTL